MTMSTVVAITEAKTAALEFIIAAMIMKIAKTIAKTIAMNIMMIIATTRAITERDSCFICMTLKYKSIVKAKFLNSN